MHRLESFYICTYVYTYININDFTNLTQFNNFREAIIGFLTIFVEF